MPMTVLKRQIGSTIGIAKSSSKTVCLTVIRCCCSTMMSTSCLYSRFMPETTLHRKLNGNAKCVTSSVRKFKTGCKMTSTSMRWLQNQAWTLASISKLTFKRCLVKPTHHSQTTTFSLWRLTKKILKRIMKN